MKKVTNSLNYEPKEGQIFTQPSLTIPDQTMSMRTILERHAKGLPTTGIGDPRNAYYDGGEYLPDPNTLDLADREEMKEQYKQELNEFTEKRKAEEQAELTKKSKQQIDLVDKIAEQLEQRSKERKNHANGEL